MAGLRLRRRSTDASFFTSCSWYQRAQKQTAKIGLGKQKCLRFLNATYCMNTHTKKWSHIKEFVRVNLQTSCPIAVSLFLHIQRITTPTVHINTEQVGADRVHLILFPMRPFRVAWNPHNALRSGSLAFFTKRMRANFASHRFSRRSR